MLKRCPEHGTERVLVADDVDYYRRCREVFLKPPEMPQRFNTPIQWGCPYDCGLCPDHEQHSCLSLVEITDHCNLQLPDLLRRQRRRTGRHSATLEHDRAHARRRRAQRGRAGRRADLRRRADHPPGLLRDPRLRRRRAPIKHLMVNTNGIRIAQDEEFARAPRRLHAGLRGVPAVRLARARRADRSCAAPTCATSASRRSSG